MCVCGASRRDLSWLNLSTAAVSGVCVCRGTRASSSGSLRHCLQLLPSSLEENLLDRRTRRRLKARSVSLSAGESWRSLHRHTGVFEEDSGDRLLARRLLTAETVGVSLSLESVLRGGLVHSGVKTSFLQGDELCRLRPSRHWRFCRPKESSLTGEQSSAVGPLTDSIELVRQTH